MKKALKIVEKIVLVILIIMVIIGGILVFQKFILKEEMPSFLGYRGLIVVSREHGTYNTSTCLTSNTRTRGI